MKREFFFDRFCGRQFVSLLEDGKLVAFAADKEKSGDIVGNIYKGRVMNVLTGMQAAFISCGLERNCYLSLDETYTDCNKYDGAITEVPHPTMDIKEGDEIIVQVTKAPRGTKGAKVTTHLSFVGKTIIYLPNTNFIGISRKITDEELREKLIQTVDKMRTRETEGFVVRTQAPNVSTRQMKQEIDYLKKIYQMVKDFAKDKPVGTLVHKDVDLPIRIMRDSLGEDVTALHVGDISLYNRILQLIRLRGDISEKKLILYQGKRSMMSSYGISAKIKETVKPIVNLESGGYIIIEHTEAMTVVDVNTGKYTGNNSLEDTVFAVNMEAAKEIALQVRLRNIGGIIVIDFIDMIEESHKEAVTAELIKYTNLDKAKINVLPMSELCVTQFTRKRVGCDNFNLLVKPCPHCQGKGWIPEDFLVISSLREKIIDCFADGYASVIVELNENIMNKILKEEYLSEEVQTIWSKNRVYMIPHKTYEEWVFSVRGDNSEVLNLPDKAQLLY